MAKQTINIGESANDGNGDPLRTAFDKVNDNFDELYEREFKGDINASIFSDDSTLLVDGVEGKIVGDIRNNAIETDNITAGNGIFDTIVGDLTGSVFADDSTLLIDAVDGTIPGYVSLADLKAEVAAATDFADFQARIAAL